MVLPQQAEQLKTRFGKAIAEEASPNEIVSIPGIRNRAAKEISVKNLSNIIQARMEEIIEMAHAEIISSGFENRLGWRNCDHRWWCTAEQPEATG